MTAEWFRDARGELTFDELVDEVSEVMPDDLVRHHVLRKPSPLGTDEALADYVAVALSTLYSEASDEEANLERIGANLENAVMALEGVIRRLRQL